jgi:hypothetical protein
VDFESFSVAAAHYMTKCSLHFKGFQMPILSHFEPMFFPQLETWWSGPLLCMAFTSQPWSLFQF